MGRSRHFFKILLCLSWLMLSPALAADSANPFQAMSNDDLIYKITLGTAPEVQALLDKGADPNAKNINNYPALCVAAERVEEASVAIAEALLKAGAKLESTTPEGDNALHVAIRVGNAPVVWLLLSKGMDFYAPNKAQKTPLKLAQENKDTKVLAMIQEAIAIDEKRKADAVSDETLQKLTKQYAYYHCAAAYLRYHALTVQKQTAQAFDALPEHQARAAKMRELGTEIITRFRLSAPTIEKIATGSAKAITQELDDLVSNANRERQGFGKPDDLQKRCDAIAGRWKLDGKKKRP
jgi:ankyrin repeat protein